jgi:N-methylhydantoinase B
MAFAGAMSVVMAFVGEDLPKNDGFYRPIETITPEGTMVNPTDNAPVAAGWEIAMRAGDLVAKALADAVPEETVAATKGVVMNIAFGGRDPRDDGRYVYYETVAGGYGARAEKDGMDAVQTHFQNTPNSPIEELESEVPVYIRRYELIGDSEGAGRQRGGLGVRRDYEFYGEEATFSLLTDRTKSEPWGLFGGESASPSRFFHHPDTDEEARLSSKSTTELDVGDVVSVRTPGGGGYGPPTERDPGAVLADVRDGKVSVEKAREVYGLAVDPEAGTAEPTAAREEGVETGEPRPDGGTGADPVGAEDTGGERE